MRYRLRDATESTRSKGDCEVDFWGASAGFSHRERLLLAQRALSVSGVALTGLGSRSRRHVSRARDERRLLGYASRGGLYRTRGRGSAARAAVPMLLPCVPPHPGEWTTPGSRPRGAPT